MGCEDLLKGGVFDVVQFSSSSSVEQNYLNFVRTVDKSSARTAQKWGLDIVLPTDVGLIPLGANFSDDQWTEWESKRSQLTVTRVKYSEALGFFMRSANRDILATYLACKALEVSALGLTARLEYFNERSLAITVSWKPVGGSNALNLDIGVVNGNCVTPIKALEANRSHALIVDRLDGEGETIVTVAGDQSNVSPVVVRVPGFKRIVFEGVHNCPTGLTMTGDELVFEDGSVIRVDTGKDVRLTFPRIIVRGKATIDGRGKTGSKGADGAPYSGGEWGSSHDAFWAARRDVEGNPNHPDRGNAGGKGGKGGPGAKVYVSNFPRGSLEVLVEGGPGGPPGRGSNGRLLRCYEHGTCDGGIWGAPPKPDGGQGDQGDPGVYQIG